MIKEIKSLDNKIVKYTLKLKENKYQKEEKKYIIETYHLLEMSLKDLEYVFSLSPLELPENITQYIVTEDILKKLSSNKSFSKVIGVVKMNEKPLDYSCDILYLDNLQDPGNIGTILRTSLAFSYFNIGLSLNTCSIYNSKVIQSAQGALFNLNFERFEIERLKEIQKEGYKILVTTLSNDSIFINEFKRKMNEKLIIVVGNEGNGVRKEIIDIADYKIKIDISNIDSLNVGIATGITLFELKK